MTQPLSSSAQKVQDYLRAQGYACTVIESPATTRTAADAAAFAGCEIGQIVKSLIFRGARSGEGVLILTSGANRVNEDVIQAHMGEPIERATPEFVREATGFAIGGVPPVGHLRAMHTFMDEDLQNYLSIWAAAGTPNAIFELTPEDLHKMTGAKVINVKQIS